MSALDFLSVGGAADTGSFHPVARSPIDRAQRARGATFEERDGWLVPTAIPGEDECLGVAGVADLSHLTVLEVQPADPALAGDDVVFHRLSARRGLVVCPPAHAASVRADLGERSTLDLSGAFGIVAITGSEAETVIRRMTHLHHFPSSGEVAHVSAHVLRPGGMFWILVAQELGQYLWEVAVDRAEALGGGPVGVDALVRAGGGS
jgi:glycine cleavage system aminomethyltransferase T